VVAAVVVVGVLRAHHWHPTDLFVEPLVRAPAANLVWEGDSQSASAPEIVTTADAAVDELHVPVLARTFATGGAVVDTLMARAPSVDGALVRLPGTRNVLVVWVGTNDLGFGEDPAAVHEQLRTYAAARRAAGWTVVVGTALPRSFLADVPGYEQRRRAFNDLVRQEWPTYADQLVDVGADPQLGAPGAQDDRALYLGDRTHLNEAGRRAAATRFSEGLRGLGLG
jgi:lysophospholipase L1-like esterase